MVRYCDGRSGFRSHSFPHLRRRFFARFVRRRRCNLLLNFMRGFINWINNIIIINEQRWSDAFEAANRWNRNACMATCTASKQAVQSVGASWTTQSRLIGRATDESPPTWWCRAAAFVEYTARRGRDTAVGPVSGIIRAALSVVRTILMEAIRCRWPVSRVHSLSFSTASRAHAVRTTCPLAGNGF